MVKNALNIGVFDYLLKPIKEDELDAVIKKAIEVVERNKFKKEQDNILRQKANEGNLAIKEKILNNLIMNNYEKNDPVHLKLSTLSLNIEFKKFFTSIFSLKIESKTVRMYKGFDMELLKFSVNNILDECCKGYIKNYELFTTIENKFVLIIDDLEYNSQEIVQLANKTKECVKKFLDIDMFIGISKNFDGVIHLKTSYDEAYEKVEMKRYLGKDDAFYESEEMQKIPSSIFQQKEKLFVNNIYSCDGDKANEIIDEVFNQADKMQLSLKQLKYFNMHIINCIVDIARNIDCDINSIIGKDTGIYERTDELNSLEAFKEFVKEFANALMEIIIKRKSNKKKKTIESILKYIDEHFSEDLTLYTISEKFFMDYTNLSKMFKEDVGKLFSKYLIDLRIKKAKELLVTSSMKIYEISEEVGYTDVRYFTKLFKEFESMTPLEYRKNKGITGLEKEEAIG